MNMRSGRRSGELSNRENEILRLAASGLTDKMIAEALAIRAGTINDYWMRIRLKLGAVSRTEAVAVHAARQTALLQEERNTLLGELAEHKRVAHELRMSEEATRALLDRALSGILVVESGRFVYVNQQLLRLTGFAPEEVLGREVAQFMEELLPDEEARNAYRERVSSDQDFQVEFGMKAKDGREVWFLVNAARFEGPGGVPERIDVLTDITELKNAQMGLEQALARAEREIAALREYHSAEESRS